MLLASHKKNEKNCLTVAFVAQKPKTDGGGRKFPPQRGIGLKKKKILSHIAKKVTGSSIFAKSLIWLVSLILNEKYWKFYP